MTRIDMSRLSGVGRRLGGFPVQLIRGLLFWTAALLPLAYLPVFVSYGTAPFLLLLGVHAIALLASHGYTPRLGR